MNFKWFSPTISKTALLIAVVFTTAIDCRYTVRAADEPTGITKPIILPPFDPSAPGCTPPPGLTKTLTFVQDNQRQFMEGVGRGLALAAKDRGLSYQNLLADNNANKMVEHLQAALESKTGAVVASPVDPPSIVRSLQQLIWSGAYVGTVVPPPAISILNAPQYLTGKALGDAAANYIKNRLSGSAKVVLLTHDNLQFLAPRFAAMRDSLKGMPGVTIVADISPITVDKNGGAAMMETILLANPTLDVVLGADTVVLGALQTLRAAGKARQDQFLAGIDGETEALEEIKKNGPYKATVNLASPVFAYAMGQHAADWLEGKSVPQAIDILPKLITFENVAAYEQEVAEPSRVYSDGKLRAEYLKMYGNICHDTRDRYLNFPWSSERKTQ